jgi:hypothetical protein
LFITAGVARELVRCAEYTVAIFQFPYSEQAISTTLLSSMRVAPIDWQ